MAHNLYLVTGVLEQNTTGTIAHSVEETTNVDELRGKLFLEFQQKGYLVKYISITPLDGFIRDPDYTPQTLPSMLGALT